MKLFGYEFNVGKPQDAKTVLRLPEDQNMDGALDIEPVSGFYTYGTSFEYDYKDETELITKYRELSQQPEFERAIDSIVNEAFAYDDDVFPVELKFDEGSEVPRNVQKKIGEEFETVLNLLNFKSQSFDVFKRWYVDGRLFYQKVVDEKKSKNGIVELKYLDPRKIRKIRKRKLKGREAAINSIDVNPEYEEFYLYNPKGITRDNPQGIPMTMDSIVYIHSGILSRNNKTVLSHMHKAIKFFNALRNVEDAVVIYRLTNSVERRVFNVEIGDLPASQAKAYLHDTINKFRKKSSYDPVSGEVVEQKRFLTMLEDFWFPKREGKGTTVENLQAGQNLGELEDVEYFKKKLYESLNVPLSRLDPTNQFSLGRSTEISREEIYFTKFIERLRKRFNFLFDDLLKTQLILKGVIKASDWEEIAKDISYDYLKDNHFSELKDSEIWSNRFNMLRDMDNIVGTYVSRNWVYKNILHMTDDEIEQMKKELQKEADENPPMDEEGNPMPAPNFGAKGGDKDEEGDGTPKQKGPPPQFGKKPKPKTEKDDTEEDKE